VHKRQTLFHSHREFLRRLGEALYFVSWQAAKRLLEVLRLRIKNIEFEWREIIIREGKGNKDRVTMLPENLFLHLQNQLAKVKQLHDKDLSEGFRRGLFAQCLGAQVSACR